MGPVISSNYKAAEGLPSADGGNRLLSWSEGPNFARFLEDLFAVPEGDRFQAPAAWRRDGMGEVLRERTQQPAERDDDRLLARGQYR